MNIEENATEKLKRHIWTTYKSRYNAHRRVLLIDKIQKITLTINSIFILGVSVIVLNTNILDVNTTQLSNIYLIVLSIILLALSLTIGQSENKLTAFKYHDCARKLHRLHNHIIMEIEKNPDFKISDEEDKYNDILDEYELNHDKIDWEYIVFQEKKKNNKKWIQFIGFHIKYFTLTVFIYIAIIIIPIAVYLILMLHNKGS